MRRAKGGEGRGGWAGACAVLLFRRQLACCAAASAQAAKLPRAPPSPVSPVPNPLAPSLPSPAPAGVFISSLKLVAFHMGFTWLTFRMFGVPLAYTAAVVCAACALLPFIPTYLIALPPCLALGAQVRGLVWWGGAGAAVGEGRCLSLEISMTEGTHREP